MKKVFVVGCLGLVLVACGQNGGLGAPAQEPMDEGSKTERSVPKSAQAKQNKGEPGTKSVEGTDENGESIIAYHFHDVEALPATDSFLEAVEAIVGEDRYYFEYSKDAINQFGEMVHSEDPNDYRLELETRDGPINREYSREFLFDLELDPTYDPRMELIDLVHYLKESQLIRAYIPSEEQSNFIYTFRLYNERKPGMNYEEPAVTWKLKGQTILEMDFTDKLDILSSIFRYGHYEGMFPPVD